MWLQVMNNTVVSVIITSVLLKQGYFDKAKLFKEVDPVCS